VNAGRPFLVVQSDEPGADRLVEDAVFRAGGVPIVFGQARCVSEDDVIAACAAADAVIAAYVPLSARVLEALTRCRIVAFLATGYNSIDLDAASRLGMVVTHVPDYCTPEVADHALGLLLALARNIVRLDASVHAGDWRYAAAGVPARLGGQSLGLVGCGRIGSAVARRAQAFGLRVLAADPYVDAATMAAIGVEKAQLADVLGCDYISLHCTLTDETRTIVDDVALAQMKPSAVLVNTARGGCVDTDALTAALQAGALAGAGLDVVDPEPLPADHPLRTLPGVVITPHAAFLSVQAEREAREKACAGVVAALRGQVPRYVVNQTVLHSPRCRLRPAGS
jgi:D-3-phosphoglycerate dehydrogenase